MITMKNMIPTPTMSEILWEEFMEPMGISAYRLAKDIHVPVSRIQEILLPTFVTRGSSPRSFWNSFHSCSASGCLPRKSKRMRSAF